VVIHIVVGTRDGSAKAGHLGEGHVRPTLEVVVTESPAHLRKVYSRLFAYSMLPGSARHHGAEFDVMMAAAEMADYRLSNEAMARRIQRIRRQ
jgi:hypothetical protein